MLAAGSGGLRLDWGDVPTWVGSVLTGVALLIAAFTYRKSVSDSQRNQAKTITVWVDEDQKIKGHFLRRTNTLHIRNGSNATVYSVTVYYRKSGKEEPTYASPYYDKSLLRLGSWASIGPGEQRDSAFERSKTSDPQIPWLYFRDANGVDWIRDYRARLKRHNYWLMRYMSETQYLTHWKPLTWLRILVIGFGLLVWYIRLGVYEARQEKAGVDNKSGEGSAPIDRSQARVDDAPRSNDYLG